MVVACLFEYRIGYAGVHIGPAAIGFLAQIFDLSIAFWLLAGLVVLVTLNAKKVTILP
jgi:hypothetical protein